ncbi:MAG: hypothetical protein Fur002_08520 [Anaerolineales bacterium]
MRRFLLGAILFALMLSACQPAPASPLELARFEESAVRVVITLSRDESHQPMISATLTPVEANLHLYSKDIPRGGVDGLGRPALLELSPDARIRARGALQESAAADSAFAEIPDLQIYPPGAVTLSLPVTLPPGDDWSEENLLITYMACTEYLCREPVEGKVVSVRVPQAEAFK